MTEDHNNLASARQIVSPEDFGETKMKVTLTFEMRVLIMDVYPAKKDSIQIEIAIENHLDYLHSQNRHEDAQVWLNVQISDLGQELSIIQHARKRNSFKVVGSRALPVIGAIGAKIVSSVWPFD